jgi:hypothetical protein
LGRAIIDLKEQFPNMTASDRADWIEKFADMQFSRNGHNAERNTESNKDS